MDRYRIDPDHLDSAHLEEGPLATTSKHEVLTYPDTQRGSDAEDDCLTTFEHLDVRKGPHPRGSFR
jgi:hypothetical protein